MQANAKIASNEERLAKEIEILEARKIELTEKEAEITIMQQEAIKIVEAARDDAAMAEALKDKVILCS